ncbi:MAG: MFS transporter [Nanoarchaeota archaeon]|nr:MFS transporter [Nanoarchaeota archaeon]
MKPSYSSNIWKYYLMVFFGALEFTIPIYVLFLIDNGLSMTQIMLLETIWILLTMLLEVPSGAFADLYGRKTALALSFLFASVGVVIFGIGNNIWIFLVAQILYAFSWALYSGTDSAFLYDSLKEINREKEHGKLFGRSRALTMFIFGGIALIGGLLAIHLGYRAMFYITAIFFFLGFIVVLFFKEPPIHKKLEDKKYLRHLKEAISFTINHPTVRNLIIYYGMFAALGHLSWFLLQPYFDWSSLPKYWVGIAVSLFFLSAGLGYISGHYFTRLYSQKKLLLTLLFISCLCFLVVYFVDPIVALIFISVMSFTCGIRDISLQEGINLHTDSHHRATVLSIQGISKSMMFAIFSLLIGIITDKYSPSHAFLMMGISLSLFFIINLFLFKNHES